MLPPDFCVKKTHTSASFDRLFVWDAGVRHAPIIRQSTDLRLLQYKPESNTAVLAQPQRHDIFFAAQI